jgi:hypothetical protein
MARKRHEGRLIAALALTAVLLFTAGEAVLFFRSESGGLVLARQGLPFPRAQVSETLTLTVQSTLRRIGVPGSAQSREAAKVEGQSVTRLTLRLPPRASLFRINSAVTGAVEQRGGRVFDAWEEPEAEGGERVTLWLGVGKALTHEVVLLRSGGGGEEEAVRLGLVIRASPPRTPTAWGWRRCACPSRSPPRCWPTATAAAAGPTPWPGRAATWWRTCPWSRSTIRRATPVPTPSSWT